jgi:Zn-dependent membrane protease YugP
MPILIALGVLMVLLLVFGPQFWVQYAMKKHGEDRPDLPGTGGELARHLLDEAGLQGVPVEPTELGDHYDPETRVVRLSHENFAGRSVTAVAVAAHEVSHAVQHAREEPGFMRRTSVIEKVIWVDRAATLVLLTTPLFAVLLKAPALIALQIGLGLTLMLARAAAHLVTLPIEYDASFRKALPVLERGGYLAESDLPAARHVLKAAAWTYVAGALATLLDVMRWFRIIRF